MRDVIVTLPVEFADREHESFKRKLNGYKHMLTLEYKLSMTSGYTLEYYQQDAKRIAANYGILGDIRHEFNTVRVPMDRNTAIERLQLIEGLLESFKDQVTEMVAQTGNPLTYMSTILNKLGGFNGQDDLTLELADMMVRRSIDKLNLNLSKITQQKEYYLGTNRIQ